MSMILRASFAVALALSGPASAAVSQLMSRGYTVLPQPQNVELRAADFPFGPGWRLEAGAGVNPNDIAVQALKEDLQSRFRIALGAQGSKTLRLSISPDAVAVGSALDPDKHAIAAQAYRIDLSNARITITANASPGLFYGVETLVQLLKPRNGSLWLPEGRIVDWPDLGLRQLYWDDAHHLDRLDELKRAIRQASFFKINGFVIKLEGHFQFKSAPALVEPQALSSAELQELTDYGLRYYVQLIPYLDAPGHIAFILKHPEYAKLRAFTDSNYELCVTNPDSYRLLYGMYQDLLDANKGVKYFYLSTDEPYYIGMANNAQCQEEPEAKRLGAVGKLLAQFLVKAAGYLHDRGREVIFWGEYPLKVADISSLPSYLINGEVYGPEFDKAFRAHGIRQMIYTSTEGEEKLFPEYFLLSPAKRLHVNRNAVPRVASAFEKVSFDSARNDATLIGMIVAGWADMGLHPSCFWLGYATTTAAGWHPGSPDPAELMSTFYPLFYGTGAVEMNRVYQLLSYQAQFWVDSWETVSSTARKPIWGNSDQIYTPRRPAHDQSLPLPPVPSAGNLSLDPNWSQENARRLQLAAEFHAGNDELLGLLHENLQHVEFNRYTLEVFLSIARLCRQNIEMLEDLNRVYASFETAGMEARNKRPRQAVAALDRALDLAVRIRNRRNATLADVTATWYKSWHPRVDEANGRRFLHELDDVKDHLPDRTVDMSYLVYRDLLLPFGDWFEKVRSARNRYAAANSLAEREIRLEWEKTSARDYPSRSPEVLE